MALKTWHKLVGGSALSTAVALGCYFEGEKLVAYHDPGNGTLTLCDGETHGILPGMTATHEDCQLWLAKGMQKELDFVDAHLLHRQPDTRRAALADFTYNEGEQRFLDSSIRRRINLGGGKVLPGLINRREAEYELCMEGVQ